jgi:excisionase family DNA binding protein
MTNNSQYISVRETAQLLGTTEKKVMDLIDEQKLQAYRIANQFLRLKRSEEMELRNAGQIDNEVTTYQYTTHERLQDFFRYNDFYIVSAVIVFGLVFLIFRQ